MRCAPCGRRRTRQMRAWWPAGRPATTVRESAGDACVGAVRAVDAVCGLAVGVDEVDLLLARGFGDALMLGFDVLVEAHALLGHDALVRDGLLGMQRDLVLFFGELGAGGSIADVGVGDRLALDADFLASGRNGLGGLVGDDVLAHAQAAGLALRRSYGHFFPGARHRVVGFGAADVVADDAGGAMRRRIAVVDGRGGLAARALGEPGVGTRLAVIETVVLVELGLFLLGELAVGVGVRRVLDLRL